MALQAGLHVGKSFLSILGSRFKLSGALPPFPIPGLGKAYNFTVGAVLVGLRCAKNRRNARVALQAGVHVGKSFLSILGSRFKPSGSLPPFPINGLGKAYNFTVGAVLVGFARVRAGFQRRSAHPESGERLRTKWWEFRLICFCTIVDRSTITANGNLQ